jgi:hypothetical protein
MPHQSNSAHVLFVKSTLVGLEERGLTAESQSPQRPRRVLVGDSAAPVDPGKTASRFPVLVLTLFFRRKHFLQQVTGILLSLFH